MTDTNTENLTENDDDLIPVETPPEEQKAEDADADADDADDDQHDEDDGDERLGESEEDNDDEVSSNRKRRQKRREVQKRAKERAERELAMLRQKVMELERRASQVEGHVTSTHEQSLAQRLAQAQREVEMAEQVIAKATAAGNGNDVVQAMRIRDAAIANAQQLEYAKQQFEQTKSRPQVQPEVANYAKQWIEANPWYDPSGRDRDSALAKAIDNELASEGYNPATREYWEELTARVADAFGTSAGTSDAPASGAPKAKRKTPPPTGGTREHAPASTKREIYVTPERKQAMIDAGVWDDPAARQRYLKAYRDYDSSAR
jgi:hypothetical protein